jgi:hypothetical protein
MAIAVVEAEIKDI